MPKLIIANAYELYEFNILSLTPDQINAMYFYNLRFLWLLEPGDAILLPKNPNKDFLTYFANIKNIDLSSLHLVILNDNHPVVCSAALSNPNLIAQLKTIMSNPSAWHIEACYFNSKVLALSEKLHLTINSAWKKFIAEDLVRTANSKVEFRKVAERLSIPIAEGSICLTQESLIASIKELLKITGQVIIKQNYNTSGKGNIGVTFSEEQQFVGVAKTMILNADSSIDELATQIWAAYINSYNTLLILEVYYPNKGTFTAQLWIGSQGEEPEVLNFSEIRMQKNWIGVLLAPHLLSSDNINELLACSKHLAKNLQMQGYRGYICCDAILTKEDKILFTEMNARPGGETNAYILARQIFGKGYENKMVVLTYDGLKTTSFIEIYKKLKAENLLLNKINNTGVVLLTVDDVYTKQLEYLVAAPNLEKAYALEKKVNTL
ncbi:MAG: hypothetical protein H0W64_10000 [Gammaproteobacteria bacterium]|nr:hypothetical protein [Gammaproteobacteria bacterium]